MRTRRTPTTATGAVAAALVITLTGCGDTDTTDSSPPDTADTEDAPEDTDSADADTTDTDTAGDADAVEDTPDTPEDTEDAGADSDVEITSHGHADHHLWGPDSYVVAYEITNSGDEAASYFVAIEFFDGDGDWIGGTGVTADHLGPGKSTEADTAPLDVEIDHGDIADIADAQIGQVDRTAD